MYIDFSSLFHQSSKDRSGQGSVKIPLDKAAWPAEWSITSYKEYPRFEKISLGDKKAAGDLFDAIRKRTSQRDFSGKPFTKDRLATLLKYACGIVSEADGGQHRAQPSGGGRYPI